MYIRHFGFREKPFTLTPNPRFVFLSRNHREAFAHLLYGINHHYGFIELIGEIGTGKTTVLRSLLAQLQQEDSYRTALIFNPCLSSTELMRTINNEFGINALPEHSHELLTELNRFLLEEHAHNRTVVLVIDEAQVLKPEVLEQVRLISNLETDNDKLIQIIIAGQPELKDLLDLPSLRQLNQRIAVRFRLRPMKYPECRAYIRHRMTIAGDRGKVAFTPLALRLLYLYSQGTPRLINILADRALLVAYGDNVFQIGPWIVLRAIRELTLLSRRRTLRILLPIGLALILVLALLPTLFHGIRTLTVSTARPVVQLPSQAPAVTVQSIDRSPLHRELLTLDQHTTHLQALNALVKQWDAAPFIDSDVPLTIPALSRLAAQRNLRLTRFDGPLTAALRFNLPLLISTKATGKLGAYCIAVTGQNNDILSITPSLAGARTISISDLQHVADTGSYLVWRNAGRIPLTLTEQDRSSQIETLQVLLQHAGVYPDKPDGIYGKRTIAMVAKFQQMRGIPVDPALGETTLAALTPYYASIKIPRLRDAKGNRP